MRVPDIDWNLLNNPPTQLHALDTLVLGIRMAQRIDAATLADFCDTLERMRALWHKIKQTQA